MNEQKMSELERLQRKMSEWTGSRTVEEWNKLREECKKSFGETITELDGSGFISKWLRNFKFPNPTESM